MEVELITTLINNLGFPIAVCIALFWQNIKTQESFSELQKVLAENTLATREMSILINQNTNEIKKG